MHEFVVKEIQKISNDTPPIEMQEKWENAHKEYVEKSAWIRQMLVM